MGRVSGDNSAIASSTNSCGTALRCLTAKAVSSSGRTGLLRRDAGIGFSLGYPESAGGRLLAGGDRLVARLPRLLHRLNALRDAEQWSGLHILAGSARRDCHGERRGADIVGHLEDSDQVVVPECHPERSDLSPELLDDLADRLDAVMRALDHSGPSCGAVRYLEQVTRHYRSPFSTGIFIWIPGFWPVYTQPPGLCAACQASSTVEQADPEGTPPAMPVFVSAFFEERRQGRRRGNLKGRSTDDGG